MTVGQGGASEPGLSSGSRVYPESTETRYIPTTATWVHNVAGALRVVHLTLNAEDNRIQVSSRIFLLQTGIVTTSPTADSTLTKTGLKHNELLRVSTV